MWQDRLVKLLSEGSMGVGKALRAVKKASKKPFDTELHKKAHARVNKWWAKKKVRTSKPSYQKSLESDI